LISLPYTAMRGHPPTRTLENTLDSGSSPE